MQKFDPSVFPLFEPPIGLNLIRDIPFVPYEGIINAANVQEDIIAKRSFPEKPIVLPNYAQFIAPTADIDANTSYGQYHSSLGKSQLGVPVISWIDLKDQNDQVVFSISDCLITVSQKPRVVKTFSIGKDGSTKTWIGQDDYLITIDGLITNVNSDGTSAAAMQGIYPSSPMLALQQLIKDQGYNLGIGCYSPYLELFGDSGIQFIVITGANFPQDEGGYSQQRFSIEAISDSYNDADVIYSPYIP